MDSMIKILDKSDMTILSYMKNHAYSENAL